MAVTSDKYELPIAVETNYELLAKTFGIKPNVLLNAISQGLSGKKQGYKFLRIKIE